jgi:hypothetical protein
VDQGARHGRRRHAHADRGQDVTCMGRCMGALAYLSQRNSRITTPGRWSKPPHETVQL